MTSAGPQTGHQPSGTQHLQVVGHDLLRQPERVGDLADRATLIADGRQNGATVRVSQRLKRSIQLGCGVVHKHLPTKATTNARLYKRRQSRSALAGSLSRPEPSRIGDTSRRWTPRPAKRGADPAEIDKDERAPGPVTGSLAGREESRCLT